tara:strand:+ start:247 stop:426 length:180 start_codon:yes stop_codon:yes gene_type:complete
MQFIRKTSSRPSIISLTIKLVIAMVILTGVVFLLNRIDFPAPIKKIEKIISNENFKIVK